MRIPFFRIFYSTTYTFLSLVLLVALLITPANLVYAAIRERQIYDIFVVSGVFLLTLIVAVLLYASRLYNNRRNLLHIPRDWSPVEKGDVEKKVRKLIAEKLEESAAIALQARPKDLSQKSGAHGPEEQGITTGNTRPSINDPLPSWGLINHPGWSSPSSTDLPNIHFEPVIAELPNLIEAKAVSLAPTDPLRDPNFPTPDSPLPDALVVELIQRPSTTSLRDYISHLTTLGMLSRPTLTPPFLALYEKARFSGSPAQETEFRNLMSMFAEILRNLRPLDAETVAQLHTDASSLLSRSSLSLGEVPEPDDGAEEEEAPRPSFDSQNTVHHILHTSFYTPLPHRSSLSLSSGSAGGSERTTRTAPSKPALKRTVSKTSRSSIAPRRSVRRMRSQAASIVSKASSAGSVIRIAEGRRELDLPFLVTGMEQEGG